MDIEQMLGVDTSNPAYQRASALVESDRELIRDLVLAREDAGLSQSEVGARMGISQSAVARIESGRRDVRLSTLRRYANAVGASVRHFVTPQREAEAAAATVRGLRLVQRVEDPEVTWKRDVFRAPVGTRAAAR